MPRLRSRISLYEAEEPIFDHFHIEPQIDRALERKVWLKSGGYLVFDQAEALTAIDVNTGRFVGKRNQDETVLKTNLEAADEVVRQLRLRNIGGIIIVDFIDMTREADRKRVSDALAQALKRDKARSSMLRISELGLVQMTRKRTRESLEEMLTEQCPKCHGRRVVKSVATLAADVLRGIHRAAGRHPRSDLLVVKINPAVARYLYDVGAKDLGVLEQPPRHQDRPAIHRIDRSGRVRTGAVHRRCLTLPIGCSRILLRYRLRLFAEMAHCGNDFGRKAFHRGHNVAMRNTAAGIEPAH